MTTITATDIKQSFGKKLQNIQKEPLIITKRNRNHAVLMGFQEYSHLKELEEYEDVLFALAAKESIKKGFVSKEKGGALLDSIK